jgi:ADP-heptose:LPS heptosyltransferase
MRILVIRRDNIGDLVCTTPLIAALRRRYPGGWIGALVNSYNAPVLEGNPDLDEVIAYTKLKHLEPGESALGALGRRLADSWRLRRMQLDAAVLATTDFVPRVARYARWLAPAQVVGFAAAGAGGRLLDRAVEPRGLERLHEVERVFRLAALLDAGGAIPPLRLVPDPAQVQKAERALGARRGPRIGVQISARRPRQQWPAERYAALVERLHERLGASALLLWNPGPPDHPRHPGDDAKADEVARRVGVRAPLAAHRTGALRELIGALAACDLVVTPDGGALHLAAALGKPIAALFGDSDPGRWRPWGVPHKVLQPASRDVADLGVDEVAAALAELAKA